MSQRLEEDRTGRGPRGHVVAVVMLGGESITSSSDMVIGRL